MFSHSLAGSFAYWSVDTGCKRANIYLCLSGGIFGCGYLKRYLSSLSFDHKFNSNLQNSLWKKEKQNLPLLAHTEGLISCESPFKSII